MRTSLAREGRYAPGRNRTCDLALRRRTLYPLSYRRGASRVAPVKVTARIATLDLAETFIISRESADSVEVVQVEIRHKGHTGYGEGAPLEHYGESAESAVAYVEEHADVLGDDPWALDHIEEHLPREQFAAR